MNTIAYWTAEEWNDLDVRRLVRHKCSHPRDCGVYRCPRGGHITGACMWDPKAQLCSECIRRIAHKAKARKLNADREARRKERDAPKEKGIVRHPLPPGVTKGTHLICRKKFRYATRAIARHWADRFHKEGGMVHMRAYHCDLCDGWHHTSDGQDSKWKRLGQ
jgi:hypothetical protein